MDGTRCFFPGKMDRLMVGMMVHLGAMIYIICMYTYTDSFMSYLGGSSSTLTWAFSKHVAQCTNVGKFFVRCMVFPRIFKNPTTNPWSFSERKRAKRHQRV